MRILAIALLVSVSFAVAQENASISVAEGYSLNIPGSELTLDFVAIPGGSFVQGSPESEIGRNDDEGPQREVSLDSFWMSTAEVSWDLFELFLYRETDSELLSQGHALDLDIDGIAAATQPYVSFNEPGFPVVSITQYAASTFCQWLSAKTGHFYRLPTEAEWEYAARAGTVTAYPVAETDLDEYAWHAGNSGGKRQRSALKQANPWGLYDMAGNVAEWVLDGYSANAYEVAASSNPMNAAEELYPRVVRGGSFADASANLRSAARHYSEPAWKKRDPQIPKSLWWLTDALDVGFRIVRPENPPPKSEWAKYWVEPITEF